MMFALIGVSCLGLWAQINAPGFDLVLFIASIVPVPLALFAMNLSHDAHMKANRTYRSYR